MGQMIRGLSQAEYERYVKAAAREAGYEEGFGLLDSDLTQGDWWAVYVRQSLEEQAQNNRIPEYLLTAARMAKEKGVLVPMDYIIVDHESSEYLDRRRMSYLRKELIAKRRIKGTIIPNQGRLSADPLHQLLFERECTHYNVLFLFGDAPSGTDWASTASRQAMAQANWLRVTTNRDNVRAGNIGRVLKGMVPSQRAPYGYKYHRDAEITREGRIRITKAWWGIDQLGPDDAPVPGTPAWVVVQIFNWIGEEARSPYWVAPNLNDMEIWAPEGGKWSPTGVWRLVRNRCYMGQHAYNANSRVPNPDRPLGEITAKVKRSVLRPKSEELRVRYEVPAIVSGDLWEKANTIITSRGRGKGKQGKSVEALLRNRLFCPRCGGPMVVRKSGPRIYYCCSKYSRPWAPQHCEYRRFVPQTWDGVVWQDICTLLRGENWIEDQLEVEGSQDRTLNKLIRLEEFKKTQSETKAAKVQEGFEGGLYDLEEAKRRITAHQVAIADADAEIRRLRDKLIAVATTSVDVITLKEELRELRNRNLDQATFEEKLDVVVKLEINVYPTEDLRSLRVSCRLGPQLGINYRDGQRRQAQSVTVRKGESVPECGKVMHGQSFVATTFRGAI